MPIPPTVNNDHSLKHWLCRTVKSLRIVMEALVQHRKANSIIIRKKFLSKIVRELNIQDYRILIITLKKKKNLKSCLYSKDKDGNKPCFATSPGYSEQHSLVNYQDYGL